MGWVRKDEADDHDERPYAVVAEFDNANPRFSSDGCSTRKVVQSHCRTSGVEPGKFVRKCGKTEQIFRDRA